MKDSGIKIMIVLNNVEKWVKLFLDLVGFLFVYKVCKLMCKVFRRVFCDMEL